MDRLVPDELRGLRRARPRIGRGSGRQGHHRRRVGGERHGLRDQRGGRLGFGEGAPRPRRAARHGRRRPDGHRRGRDGGPPVPLQQPRQLGSGPAPQRPRLQRPAPARHRPPFRHQRRFGLLPGRRARDPAFDPGLPPTGPWLERHRLQRGGRPLRDHLGGARRCDRSTGAGQPCPRLQHRLGGCDDDRRIPVRCAQQRRGRFGRQGVGLEDVPGRERPAVDRPVHLGWKPVDPRRRCGHAAEDRRSPRRRCDGLSRWQCLLPPR